MTQESPSPIISVGYDPHALACISPYFPEVFHFPLPGWPALTADDGYASYALKIAEAQEALLPANCGVRVGPNLEGADLRLAAVLLVIRANGGPNALTPALRDRAAEIAPRLATVTRVAERPWTLGSRTSGVADTDLDLPEVTAFRYHPSTQAALALLTNQWAQFLLAVLDDQEHDKIPLGIEGEAARALLIDKLPECRAASLTVPPDDFRRLGHHVATYMYVDTRWSPVIVLDRAHEIHFHPGFLHTDLLVPLDGSLAALTPLARRLSDRERQIGSTAAWRAVANPRCVFRNQPEATPSMSVDELGSIVESFIGEKMSPTT